MNKRILKTLGIVVLISTYANAHDYSAYLHTQSGSTLAVIVVDMYVEEDGFSRPGLEDTSEQLAGIVATAFSMGALVICVSENSFGCPQDIIPENIKAHENYHFLQKKPFQLSGFAGGELKKLLDDQNRNHLVVAGAFTTLCVQVTIRDSLKLGYLTTLFPHTITTKDGWYGSTPTFSQLKGLLMEEEQDFMDAVNQLKKEVPGNIPQIICTPSRNITTFKRFDPDDSSGAGSMKGTFSVAQ